MTENESSESKSNFKAEMQTIVALVCFERSKETEENKNQSETLKDSWTTRDKICLESI